MADELVRYLPAIYQDAGDHSLLFHLLRSFEKILIGRDDEAPLTSPGLEAKIADLASIFNPDTVPREFLPWLAGWVALSLRADLSDDRKREIVGKIVPVYGRRGTRKGIEEMVELFTGGKAEIEEQPDIELQIGLYSTVAHDTYLGGPRPHTFHVRFHLPPDHATEEEDRIRGEQVAVEVARAAIDMAKPAHTVYTLEVVSRWAEPRDSDSGPTRRRRPGSYADSQPRMI